MVFIKSLWFIVFTLFFQSNAIFGNEDVCHLPVTQGEYQDDERSIAMYYHNYTSGRCQVFDYKGAMGNDNRFLDERNCLDVCRFKNLTMEDYYTSLSNKRNPFCYLQKDSGTCHAHVKRYYFNLNTEQCESFVWRGCRSNPNNFKSHASCENVCGIPMKYLESNSTSAGVQVQIELLEEPSKHEVTNESEPEYDNGDSDEEMWSSSEPSDIQHGVTIEPELEHDDGDSREESWKDSEPSKRCSQPIKSIDGSCKNSSDQSWFSYEPTWGICILHAVGCCAGGNCFSSRSECYELCKSNERNESTTTEITKTEPTEPVIVPTFPDKKEISPRCLKPLKRLFNCKKPKNKIWYSYSSKLPDGCISHGIGCCTGDNCFESKQECSNLCIIDDEDEESETTTAKTDQETEPPGEIPSFEKEPDEKCLQLTRKRVGCKGTKNKPWYSFDRDFGTCVANHVGCCNGGNCFGSMKECFTSCVQAADGDEDIVTTTMKQIEVHELTTELATPSANAKIERCLPPGTGPIVQCQYAPSKSWHNFNIATYACLPPGALCCAGDTCSIGTHGCIGLCTKEKLDKSTTSETNDITSTHQPSTTSQYQLEKGPSEICLPPDHILFKCQKETEHVWHRYRLRPGMCLPRGVLCCSYGSCYYSSKECIKLCNNDSVLNVNKATTVAEVTSVVPPSTTTDSDGCLKLNESSCHEPKHVEFVIKSNKNKYNNHKTKLHKPTSAKSSVVKLRTSANKEKKAGDSGLKIRGGNATEQKTKNPRAKLGEKAYADLEFKLKGGHATKEKKQKPKARTVQLAAKSRSSAKKDVRNHKCLFPKPDGFRYCNDTEPWFIYDQELASCVPLVRGKCCDVPNGVNCFKDQNECLSLCNTMRVDLSSYEDIDDGLFDDYSHEPMEKR